jgi:Golgi phosphoprotein 3
MADKNLSTAEKFVMIAHHPERGRFMVSQMFIQYGIAGAILLDMTLENSFDIKDGNLILKSGRQSDKTVTGIVASMISESGKSRKPGYWVRRIAGRYNRYLRYILKDMEQKRHVRLEDRRFLGLIRYQESFLIESYTRANLIRQLKNSILTYKGATEESIALEGLIEACRMQRILSSDRDELRTIKTQLKKIVKESPVSDAVGKTIREVQTAIMASITGAVVAATAGGRH